MDPKSQTPREAIDHHRNPCQRITEHGATGPRPIFLDKPSAHCQPPSLRSLQPNPFAAAAAPLAPAPSPSAAQLLLRALQPPSALADPTWGNIAFSTLYLVVD
jgi:hypothetical protein